MDSLPFFLLTHLDNNSQLMYELIQVKMIRPPRCVTLNGTLNVDVSNQHTLMQSVKKIKVKEKMCSLQKAY